jgi:MarR family transcriptional regulator, lower aerobic nicotinate degradation pathway regulator
LPKSPLNDLYRRPGFLIRRAHQTAVSLFLEETGELGITNRQYGILLVLKHRPGIDQITVAKLLGLDRSTTGMVLATLEKAGFVGRMVGAKDRRRRSLKLTAAGARMLTQLAEPARRAQARVLSAFTACEREIFLDLLEKFALTFNKSSRVPQMMELDVSKTSSTRSFRGTAQRRARNP